MIANHYSLYMTYYLTGIVAINLHHLFLIKQLRERKTGTLFPFPFLRKSEDTRPRALTAGGARRQLGGLRVGGLPRDGGGRERCRRGAVDLGAQGPVVRVRGGGQRARQHRAPCGRARRVHHGVLVVHPFFHGKRLSARQRQ
jgi:hypothetical protein